MRGSPVSGRPEHGPISTELPAPRPEKKQAVRVSTSPYAKPKVLMGEVVAPPGPFAASGGRGQMIGAQRNAFRAFMTARGLRPTQWAQEAGVPAGEILAFLTGHARAIPDASLQKLAATANVSLKDMLG